MSMNYKIIGLDDKFVIHTTVRLKNGLKSYAHLLDSFLTEEHFVFDVELHDDKYHYHILCESFTDAAKLETFLATAPIIC